MTGCLLCNQKAVTTRQDNSSRTIYNCGSCGVYVVSDLAVKSIKKHLAEVSAFLRHRHIAGNDDIVLISFDKAKLDKGYVQLTVNQIAEQFPKSFSEQMEKSLVNFVTLSGYAGEEIRVETLDSAPLFYLKTVNFDALSFIIKAMAKAGLIEVNYYSSSFFPCGVIVSPKGWDAAARLGRQNENVRPRILLLFNSASEPTAEVLRAAAQKSAKECNAQLITGDTIKLGGGVGSELEAQIKMSAYLLIDLSATQPESLYAAGYARALRKPLLLTCHEKDRKKLKIDSSRMGVIFWQDGNQLQLEMFNFIKASE